MQAHRITVAIPTHTHTERYHNLLDLIRSLEEKSNIEFIEEILVIDNGSSLSVSEREELSQNMKVRIIDEPEIGLNVARNRAIKEAVSDIIAFLDDDVVVKEYWASNLIDPYNRSDAYCVGGTVTVDLEILKKMPSWLTSYFLRFLLPPEFPQETSVIEAPYFLIGANMSFKKKIFSSVGYFDVGLDRKAANLLSNGDTEMILRIPQNKVWFAKGADVITKIKTERLTRMFMIRRLYWQGISDRILIDKIGVENFYDRHEVVPGFKSLQYIVLKMRNGLFLEAFCALVRIFGFSFGYLLNK
jgi:glycosyltransferase involved in cell wall biosynthesis